MIDWRAFVNDQFGGPVQMHEFLSKHVEGVPPLDTVRKWYTRDSIPSPWFAACLCLLDRRDGGPVSLVQYLGKGAPEWYSLNEKPTHTGAQPSIFD